jgi:putative DNA primase/helicase
VTEAVKEYKADSDPIGDFLEAETASIPQERVGASALYDAYVEWCNKNGADPISKKGFGISMAGRGHKKIKSNGNNYWLNLKLLTVQAPAGGGVL